MQIRRTLESDLPGIRCVLETVNLFPPEMLGDLIAEFLRHSNSRELWISCLVDGTVAGFAYVAPEELTDGTVNMLALAVGPDQRRSGCGRALVAHAEALSTTRGARMMIVDTSGSDDYTAARAFYADAGYEEEARIRDFWAAGDDKITFRKLLA